MGVEGEKYTEEEEAGEVTEGGLEIEIGKEEKGEKPSKSIRKKRTQKKIISEYLEDEDVSFQLFNRFESVLYK